MGKRKTRLLAFPTSPPSHLWILYEFETAFNLKYIEANEISIPNVRCGQSIQLILIARAEPTYSNYVYVKRARPDFSLSDLRPLVSTLRSFCTYSKGPSLARWSFVRMIKRKKFDHSLSRT